MARLSKTHKTTKAKQLTSSVKAVKRACILSLTLGLLPGAVADYCSLFPLSNFLPPALAQEASDNSDAAAEIASLEKAVERARAGKKQTDLADSLYQLGKSLAEKRLFERAQTYLEEALAIDQQLDKPKSLVNDYMALAMVQAFQKQYDKADGLYQKALEIARAKAMASMVVAINNSLGSDSIYAGNYEKAKNYFNEAKQGAKAANDFVGEAQGSLNLALIFQHEGDFKNAIAETEAAAKLLEGPNGDELLAAQTALNLGQLKDKSGDLDGALAQYQKIVQTGADLQIEASAWLAMGNIQLSRGQAREADAAFAKALAIYQAENTTAYIPLLLVRRGCALADMGKFSEAEKLHVEAIKAARESKSNDNIYTAKYELAYDFYLEGNSEKALSDFKALQKDLGQNLSVSDNGALGDVLTSIALCYRAMGQSAVARDYYGQAMAFYTKNKKDLAAAKCQNSIAVTYLDVANFGEFKKRHEALVATLAALPAGVRESREGKRFVGDVAYNFGQSQLFDAKDEAALSSYKEALAAYRDSGDLRGQMNALAGIGLAQFQAGRATAGSDKLKEAVKNFDQARSIASQLGSTEGEWNAVIGEGSCQRSLGDNAAAEKNLLAAIQLFEKEKGHFSRDDSKTFALDLRFQAFDELVALQFDQKRFDDALATTERGKARAFLDLLEGRRRNVFGDGKLAVLTGAEQAGPAGAAKAKEAPVATIAMALEGTGDPYATATRGVAVVPRNPVQADLETALSPINADAPDLAQIKALVASHKTCAVEYFVTRDNLYIFVAHPDRATEGARIAIARKDLEALVSKTYGSVIDPPKDFSDLQAANQRRDKNLADLYNVLIKPIKPYLPDSPESLVTVIPHRALFVVPFAALIGEDKKFFVEEHTISVVPAIGVLRATEHMAGERETTTTADKLLAFGNPAIKNVPGLGPLPYAEQEVKKISSLFGADRSLIKTGGAATKGALNSLAGGYNVIHLATHGLTDEEHPMDSAVLLATEGGDDGVLSVRDILKMPALKAHLVTLSACQTGRGKISGDGVAGLSRSFIIAGTPSVLVSLWNVDDVMTAYQMESFYKDYLTSASKAQALRAAQVKTIAFLEKGLTAKGERANPRYWAAFQLVGEAR